MNYLQVKISEIKNIMDTSPKSYIIYLFSFSIFIPIAIVLFFTSKKLFLDYIEASNFFFVPSIIFAFLIDSKWLIYNIAKTKIGQIMYAVLAYFAYTIAEVFSKNIIYTLTSVDPEQFESAIKFMVGLYFIPAWATIIFFVLSVIIMLMSFFLIILQLFYSLFGKISVSKTIQNKIISYLKNKFHAHKYIVYHMVFFTIGLMLFSTIYLSFINEMFRMIPEKKIASIILSNTSYYKNQSCQKIPSITYIKLVGDNKASILELDPNEHGVNLNMGKNITFKMAECN